MSWTRRRINTSHHEMQYTLHDDFSFDSGSEESTYKMLAFLSQPTREPTPPPQTPPTPKTLAPARALDYFNGRFEPHDHIAYDPAFSRYFIFHDPQPTDKPSHAYTTAQGTDKFR